MNLTTRIPAENGHVWTEEQAKTALGKPLLDRVGDDARRCGTIRAAWVENGDLVLTVQVDNAAVEYDLEQHIVHHISLVPKPRVAS